MDKQKYRMDIGFRHPHYKMDLKKQHGWNFKTPRFTKYGIPNKLKNRNWHNMVNHACAFFRGVIEIMPCKMDVVFQSMETKE